MTESQVVSPSPLADVPDWVLEQWELNMTGEQSTLLWRLARLLRRGYRLLVMGTLAVVPVLLRRRRGQSRLHSPAARTAALVTAIAAVPVLGLGWMPPPATRPMLLKRAGRLGGEPPEPIDYEWVSLDRIAPSMQLAALVSEDIYFFWHFGFNPLEIWRAYRYNRKTRATAGGMRGGSTISQQVARNLFLAPSQTYRRKLTEAFLAALIEGLWPKRRILETYLNIVYFGQGVFGVEAAARRYFGVTASELSGEQAALMAAAIRGPREYPLQAPTQAMRMLQGEIQQRMAWCGHGMLGLLEK